MRDTHTTRIGGSKKRSLSKGRYTTFTKVYWTIKSRNRRML